jgi:hypothetical protein
MAGMHRSRALGLSIAVVGLAMVAGCLSLTTSQQGGGGNGGSGSSGGACESIADCPSITVCKTMLCIQGTCVEGFVPDSVPCNDNRVCDGAGSCVECVADQDCPEEAGWCENNQCISCNDGVKNGEETDIDCGGPKCSPCATPCTGTTDCATGNCVDGVCCETACTGDCRACNLPGKVGKCVSLPLGTEDPGVCDVTKACGGGFGGECKLKNGQSCTDDSQCLSGDCSSATNVCED